MLRNESERVRNGFIVSYNIYLCIWNLFLTYVFADVGFINKKNVLAAILNLKYVPSLKMS